MIQGRFFDGQTPRPKPVELELTRRRQAIFLLVRHEGQVLFDVALSTVKIDDHFAGAGRRIELANDQVIHVDNSGELTAALKQVGYNEGVARSIQSSWRWAIGAVVVTACLAVVTYLYGIPVASKWIVAAIPTKVDTFIGEQAWDSVEKELFKPTTLSEERQAELRKAFEQVANSIPDAPKHQVLFRASKFGPNAIALPDGKIVFTDEIARLTTDDRALQGVYAHELGHVKYRHSMRNIVQVTAVTAVLSVWFGDLSNLVVAVPTAMASLKYSRDIEIEADDFALATMRSAGISTEPLAQMFSRLPKDIQGLPSSHPVTADRIKKFSEPAAK